jgi:hypothetical protein
MKKLFLASAVTFAAISAMASGSFADVSEQMKNSKYCETNSYDVLCMGPEWQKMRTDMMAMTKDTAIAGRTKYCQENAGTDDPICDPKMMNDATGY